MIRSALLFVALMLVSAAPLRAEPATVLYKDKTVALEQTLADPADLWVSPEDLLRATGFELKPEGACLAEVCIPIDQTPGAGFIKEAGGKKWFNLSAFARKLKMAEAADREKRVWSYGPFDLERSQTLESAIAPDFTLPDRKGGPVSLSQFRGKKVLLVTWASW